MIYLDSYGIVDLEHIVHAIPVNPCLDPEHAHGAAEWGIGLVLGLSEGQGHTSALRYPTRQLRDAAFETLCGLMQRVAARRARFYALQELEEAEAEEED